MKQVQRIELTHAVPVDGRGRRSNHTLLLIRARDLLVVEAARYFPSPSDRETARQLRKALMTYSSGRWRRDCSLSDCPPQYAGTYRMLFWVIFKLHDAIPGERTIRAILSQCSIRCLPSDE
jgi:hypothetical protein